MRLALRLFLAALLAPALAAQPSTWTPLDGPSAADFHAAAVAADGALFAATDTELFRYDPAAGRWSVAVGTFTGSFHDVATGPGGRVWAGTGGVFRSLDGGHSWDWFPVRTAQHSGLPATIADVAVGPDATVYAARYRSTNEGLSWPEMTLSPLAMAFVGATTYAATADGVHRSTSAGATWTPSGLGGTRVEALAAAGTRLAAATPGALWRSDDGTTWTQTAVLGGVRTLAATAGGAFWAARADGLYRSGNGTTWPATPTAFAGEDVRDVAANGAVLLALVGGVPFRSTDAGATWAAVTNGLTLRYATDALAADGRLAIAALTSGPFLTDDGGTTWAPWTEGLGGHVRRFALDPASDQVVARTQNAVYRAAAVGAPWAPSLLPDDRLLDLLAADGAGTFFVSLTTFFLDDELYRSTDGGTTWTLARALPDERVDALAGGGGLVAAAVGPRFGGPPHLLVSTDGGATWAERPHPTGDAARHFVDAFGRIYVGDGNRLRRSGDGGVTWAVLGAAGPAANRARALLAEPGGVLCLGTDQGVYCSADDGASFAPANDGLPGARPVVALVRDGARYVALTEHDGAFASEGASPAVTVALGAQSPPVVIGPDGGSFQYTVTLTNTIGWSIGVDVWTSVAGPVARDPLGGPVSLLLQPFQTVERTLTQQVPAGAPAGTYVLSAHVGVFPGTVFDADGFTVMKQGSAVVARSDAAPGDGWTVSGWEEAAASTSAVLPDGFTLSEAMPNPFTSAARLTLDLAEGQPVEAAVFDALGRVVAVLHDGALEAGAHALVLDGASLPAGVYVVRVTGETFSATRRLTLVR